jgi:hypothetical protein
VPLVLVKRLASAAASAAAAALLLHNDESKHMIPQQVFTFKQHAQLVAQRLCC